MDLVVAIMLVFADLKLREDERRSFFTSFVDAFWAQSYISALVINNLHARNDIGQLVQC